MTDARRSGNEPLPEGEPEQVGESPDTMPWTLVVENGEAGGWSADLEHGAPLPGVDDLIEYIAETGERRTYRVTRVVHTLQRSASERPPVSEETTSPNAVVTDGPSAGPPRALRAGLPRVFVSPEE